MNFARTWPDLSGFCYHSGGGFADSIWFPYANTRRLMPHVPENFTLMTMLEPSMPRHADLPDFLTRAAFAAPRWLPAADRRAQLAQLAQLATARWRPGQAA